MLGGEPRLRGGHDVPRDRTLVLERKEAREDFMRESGRLACARAERSGDGGKTNNGGRADAKVSREAPARGQATERGLD